MTRKRDVSATNNNDNDNDSNGPDENKKLKSSDDRDKDEAALCVEMCGFYASRDTLGRCSKCFADYTATRGESEESATALALATNEGLHGTPEQAMGMASGLSPMSDLSPSSSLIAIDTEPLPTSSPATTCATSQQHHLPPASTASLYNGDGDDLDAAAGCVGGCTTLGTPNNSMGMAATLSHNITTTTSALTNGEVEDEKKLKKNKCFSCKKKLGLTGFACRCGGLFCSFHRYSDEHACPYNYQQHGQEEIRKNNPVVIREKIQKL